MNRKRWWALVVGVVVIGGAVAVWRWRRAPPQEGFVVGLRALDDGGAIVLWRANYNNSPTRGWITRLAPSAAPRWSRELPEVPQSVAPGNAMALTNDVVAVRYSHSKYGRRKKPTDHSLAAYALADGRPRWDITLTSYQGETTYVGGAVAALTVAPDRLLEWANDGAADWVYTVDATNGRIIGRNAVDDIDDSALVMGGRAIVTRYEKAVVIDANGGAPTVLPTAGVGCLVGDEYVNVFRHDGDLELAALRGGDRAARRVIMRPFHPLHEAWLSVEGCGHYRDRLVFLLDANLDPTGAGDESSFVVITDANGVAQKTLELGQDLHWSGSTNTRKKYAQAAPLAGELSRFVLYPRVPVSSDAKPRLVMIDLEEGKIAWQGPDDERLIYGDVFHVGERSYYVSGGLQPVYAAFDGATGKLVAAVRAYAYDGIEEPSPLHIAGGNLWITSGKWEPIGRAPVAVLDAATLHPQSVRGLELTDVTAELRAELGLAR